MSKYVYTFGAGKADGRADMKNLLGGKGANLAEMSNIGVPVPAGFTISTEMCAVYYKNNRNYPPELADQVKQGIAQIEATMGGKFGDPANPLLVSVRSGARASMPGMMDTILNLGLNDEVVEGMAKAADNARFAWDSYRRFIQMYGDVVLGLKPETKEEHDPFEVIIDQVKHKRGVTQDTDLGVDDLKELVSLFRKAVKDKTGHDFPTDPMQQLWGAVEAVFGSWMNNRAMVYRRLNGIPDEWGTAVNVQAMVFGNMGNDCATGVAFTRDASTGEDIFNGEYLINAQGEDVVAGIRTPLEITREGSRRWAKLQSISEEERVKNYPSLEEAMPTAYQRLNEIQQSLEDHYKDMQDIEFTIQKGKVWMLQTRNGKRTGPAMVRIAMEMLDQGKLDEKTAVLRVEANRLNELLHPVFDKEALTKVKVLTRGLPASPGASTGQIVFFSDEVENWVKDGKKVILVRLETSPEDLAGMHHARGILTARGGMTSHAAVVARGMGKCCVAGAGQCQIDYKARTLTIEGRVLKEGDWISLNGSTGEVLDGAVPTQDAELTGNFERLMALSDKYRKIGVRTNADTPADSIRARSFGAQGIGLCRTEHMFFEGERIKAMREMILANTEADRRKALAKLLPYQREDFYGIFKAMHDLPVTIRTLDPPLHEFLPHDEPAQREMAEEMGVTLAAVQAQVAALHEFNPMLGHRGCRLGITYPEITEMQARAIMEAACQLAKEGVAVYPEIMIPLVGVKTEFIHQKNIVVETAEKVIAETGQSVKYLVGTMIEIPRAALTADEIAGDAQFFSFGTNDLTQMTFGFSRDDAGKFLSEYYEKKILPEDPFQSIDQTGVGQLIKMGVDKGRSVRPDLKVGICGEHGGDPKSVEFCHKVGMNYVSCSPFRVPIARLAAAHAAIKGA